MPAKGTAYVPFRRLTKPSGRLNETGFKTLVSPSGGAKGCALNS